jgi:hypothetical protein
VLKLRSNFASLVVVPPGSPPKLYVPPGVVAGTLTRSTADVLSKP